MRKTLLALLLASCRPPAPAPAAPPPPAAVVVAPRPPPRASPCPPADRVLRDARVSIGVYLEQTDARLRGLSVALREPDPDEPDVCDARATGRDSNGARWTISSQYILRDGFHRLIWIEPRVR